MSKRKYKFNLPISESRLSALSSLVADETGAEVKSVPIAAIAENPFQPRRRYSQSELEDLSASIREHGILQPLVGRAEPNGDYTLIAGHRRLKAAGLLGMTTVPMILRDSAGDDDLRALALIENIQREDLNAVDKARALAEFADRFENQAAAAQSLGLKRDALAQWLRLRQLPDDILEVCAGIPGLSLQKMLGLVKAPPQYRLREAKRLLAVALAPPSETKATKKADGQSSVRRFKVVHPERKIAFTVEIRPHVRKRAVTDDEYREALRLALAEFDPDGKP